MVQRCERGFASLLCTEQRANALERINCWATSNPSPERSAEHKDSLRDKGVSVTVFNLEIKVDHFVKDEHFLALGMMKIRINNVFYGIDEIDASWLGNTVGELKFRINNRGCFMFPNLDFKDPVEFGMIFLATMYGSHAGNKFDQKLIDAIFDRKLMWIPDGDSAFDDGSHIIHLDMDQKVKLIGFKNEENSESIARSVRQVTIPADEFYGKLQECLDSFTHARQAWLLSGANVPIDT